MKTLGITRTIRRKLLGGWFVTIGPTGLAFRQRRQKVSFFISWKEAGGRAMALAVEDELSRPVPLLGDNFNEMKDGGKQKELFPEIRKLHDDILREVNSVPQVLGKPPEPASPAEWAAAIEARRPEGGTPSDREREDFRRAERAEAAERSVAAGENGEYEDFPRDCEDVPQS